MKIYRRCGSHWRWKICGQDQSNSWRWHCNDLKVFFGYILTMSWKFIFQAWPPCHVWCHVSHLLDNFVINPKEATWFGALGWRRGGLCFVTPYGLDRDSLCYIVLISNDKPSDEKKMTSQSLGVATCHYAVATQIVIHKLRSGITSERKKEKASYRIGSNYEETISDS